jgi:hypothetical protein
LPSILSQFIGVYFSFAANNSTIKAIRDEL